MLARTVPHIPDRWFETERYAVEDRGYATPCWVWLLSVDGGGYGQVVVKRSGRQQSLRAHRVYYEREHGPIAVELHLDHLCRVRNCVNPAHLEVVTCAENVRRGHGPASRMVCPQGHPYTPENTYTGGGRRKCRACHRAHQRAYVERQREAVAA